jgi:type II restriction/modification system DNA methylase subunit YeeA
VDAIIGNPPFLGDKKMLAELGEPRVNHMREMFLGRVPGGADLVCYWIAKAWDLISADHCNRAGLVTTNSIRGVANRRVLDPIAGAGAIFDAWADEAWVLKGAAVRVSMIGFGHGFVDRRLNGVLVPVIRSDLTSQEHDLTKAGRLSENAGLSFIGTQKNGSFDVDGELARSWLLEPTNPNGLSNKEVLAPRANQPCSRSRSPTSLQTCDQREREFVTANAARNGGCWADPATIGGWP